MYRSEIYNMLTKLASTVPGTSKLKMPEYDLSKFNAWENPYKRGTTAYNNRESDIAASGAQRAENPYGQYNSVDYRSRYNLWNQIQQRSYQDMYDKANSNQFFNSGYSKPGSNSIAKYAPAGKASNVTFGRYNA